MTFKIHDGVEIDGKSLTNSGGNLTWGGVAVGSGGGVTINSNANNRVLTGDGTNAVAETKLTFDGTNLQIVAGDATRGLISERWYLGATDTSFIERDSTVNIGYRADGIHKFSTYQGSWIQRFEITDNDVKVLLGELQITSGSSYTTHFNYQDGGNNIISQGNSATTAIRDSGGNRFVVSNGGGAFMEKLAVKSLTPHPSYDFYNNGTSYFNGAVIVDDALDITGTNRALKIAGTTVIDASKNLTNIGTISSGAITANTGGTAQNALDIGGSAATNYTIQRWLTSAHSGNEAYIIAYGASHVSEAGNFGIKNVEASKDIFFELSGGVQPLRLTSTGATFAGDGFFNGTKLVGDSKHMISFADTWLRLNPDNHFTSGIYAGTGLLRTDGHFQVGSSGAKFSVNGSTGNVTVAGTVDGRDVAADGTKLDGIAAGANNFSLGSTITVSSDIQTTAGLLKFTSNNHILSTNNANNILLKSGTGAAMGLLGQNSSSHFRWQIYGDGTQYGFLDATWGSWDIQKAVNGALKVDEGSGLKRVLNEANWTSYATATNISNLGINANLLDGLDSTEFFRNTQNIGSTAVDNLTTRGVYGNSNQSSGQPYDNNAGTIIHLDGYDTAYKSQIFQYSANGAMYLRGKHGSSNSWSSWYQVYDEQHKPTLAELGYTGATNANYITNNNQLTNGAGYATQSYVGTQISNLVDSSPAALNTLNELAAAIGDDASFSTTVTNNIATKLPKAGGTMTGTLTTSGNIAVPSNTGLQTSGTETKFTTAHGYIQLGPMNTSHAHIYTDRSNFYFNKTLIYASGHLMYHAGNSSQFTSALNTKLAGIATSANNYVLPTALTATTFATSGQVVIGGNFTNNAYSSVSSTRLLFGGGNEPNDYYIGTNLENFGGNYTKLDLRWHTGIRMGAQGVYGGIRFYNNEDLTSKLMSIGEGSGVTDVKVYNNLVVGGTVDGRDVAADGSKLDGIATSANNYSFPYAVASGNTASAIVQRNSSGDFTARYIFGTHFNQSSSNTENPTIAAFWTNSSADTYCRKSSISHVGSQLGPHISFDDLTNKPSNIDNADKVDGLHAASLLRSDAADTASGAISFTAGHGAINITSSSIVSNASSTWTGNPGTQGKIQYHANRWYIVSDSSSDRIVQFRKDGSDQSYIANNGNFFGNINGNITGTGTSSLNRVVTSGLYGTGHGSSILPIWQYNAGNPGYGIGYYESSPDVLRFDVSNNLMSGTADLELRPNELRVNGNVVLTTASTIDADTLGGLSLKSATGTTGSNQVLRSHSNGYFYHQNWIDIGASGIYSSSTNGAHFKPNDVTSYGTWASSGAKNGYDGIAFDGGGDVAIMFDSAGNGGFYRQANSRWIMYHLIGNNCTGFGTSTTSSSYQMYVAGAIYATGDIVGSSDERLKTEIKTIPNALDKVLQLRGVTYKWKEKQEENNITETRMGVIAQEILDIVPEVVTHDVENDRYGVSYGHITGLLIEAIKQQQEQINELKKEIKGE